ncbi:SCO family protein [Allostreptomyces psammosilenae]|uniref:Protein SCO1/2 n=1 Tax=Allostreptomyces psammosilenae TaxID=1892865 RepID=A0A852ZV47_9ACTN|nr:SCO family protein [Allostreptomyces psammosilenae]NYI05487.1 protein SCO1/2 [Allostreptomyces psammosilenae]
MHVSHPAPTPPATARRSWRLAAALGAASCLLLAGCGSGAEAEAENAASVTVPQTGEDSPYLGTVLDKPFSKPELTLTDTEGQPFDLRAETAGEPTLLYFGYTHCPDVCPTTMADLALAKRELPEDQRDALNVVFVTTDPERDTPESLRSWLDAMDATFIGLTGDFATIQEAARTVGVAVEEPVVNDDGSVTSTHGTQVLAYGADDVAHVVYLSGTPADDYAHDLPLLMDGVAP